VGASSVPTMPIFLLLLLLTQPAHAQTPQDAKCARYATAWTEAQQRFGRGGLGDAFVADNNRFIAAECRTRMAICPRSPQELAMADILTIAAMNAGMASSFVPFRCPA
jgi:hypothetical protein